MKPDSIVTPEEFSRYVDTHIGTFSCEVCKTQGWDLLHDPSVVEGGPALLQPERKGEHGRRLALQNSCIVSCKHCGNMKMFNRDHITFWLLEHPIE